MIRKLWRTMVLLPVIGVGFIIGSTIITIGRQGLVWAMFMTIAGLIGIGIGSVGTLMWLERPRRSR